MTGFGDAQYEEQGISFLAEIRALNNRFLKTSIKLPDALAFAEPEVERVIRKELGRGSITYSIHMRYIANTGPFEVNHTVMQGYMQHLNQVLTLHSSEKAISVDLASLLQLPGVCQLREYSEDEHKFFLKSVKKLTKKALERLQKMRCDEGKSIIEDLKKHCDNIKKNLDDLAKLTKEVVDNYRRRIQNRVNEMLSEASLKLNEELLAKEVALFAERSDINEEISRLNSHLIQFMEACESDEQAGRRLDFLTQELLREANTIASKANSATISQHVVEIKVAIDRLKEQVQNVE